VSDIVESTSASENTFRAITTRAKVWMNDLGIPSGMGYLLIRRSEENRYGISKGG
jgi:hypothetical protein